MCCHFMGYNNMDENELRERLERIENEAKKKGFLNSCAKCYCYFLPIIIIVFIFMFLFTG